jgi:hypothetical protein
MAWSNKGERMADQVKAVDDFITALWDAGKIRNVSQLDHIKDDLENLLIKQVEEARQELCKTLRENLVYEIDRME